MQQVINLFERQHRDDRFPGGQLVIHRRGPTDSLCRMASLGTAIRSVRAESRTARS